MEEVLERPGVRRVPLTAEGQAEVLGTLAAGERSEAPERRSASLPPDASATLSGAGGQYGYDSVCIASVRRVMEVFGGKWAFLVLEQLHVGTMRFGDLRRALGVSTKSLTDTLRHLEECGIIERKAYPTVPVTVEYSLTEKGRSFDSVLLAMKEWGRTWL